MRPLMDHIHIREPPFRWLAVSPGLGLDVREPQPGVTAGFAVCSRLWEFRTGIQRSLLSPVSRFGSALGLHWSSC